LFVSEDLPIFAPIIDKLLMRKFLLISTILFLLAVPVLATGMLTDPASSAQFDEPSIAVEGHTVTVSGAQGKTLQVVSLTGRLVAEYEIDAPVQRLELNLSKGCYILKVGKVVRKVSIR
jgi:hypothetical protein